ncbi:MAG: patatin-like phospholipase family protein [Roseicyclus sp.]
MPEGSAADLSRPRLGLALGAGAARGLAHIGALRAMAEIGVRPAALAGCSIGAVVAASYAAGRLDRLETAMRGVSWLQVARLVDLGMHGGLIDSVRLHDFLEDILGTDALEDLPLPVTVIAADMVTGREVWLNRGSVIDAVSASIAMPGLFPPVRMQRRWLVDGAVVNPLPVSAVRAMDVDAICAVNLSGPLWRVPARELHPRASEAALPRLGWLAALTGRRGRAVRVEPLDTLCDPMHAGAAPGSLDVMSQSLTVMQDIIARMRLAGDPCDVLIAPDVRRIGLFQFDRADELIEAGHRAVAAERERLIELVADETSRHP